MTQTTERVLRDLLAWDRTRILRAMVTHQQTFPEYEDRQDRAEVALLQPIPRWSLEIREYWQTLVEVHGDAAAGAPLIARIAGIGVERILRGPASARDFGQLLSVAAEIGVLSVLRGAGSSHWRRSLELDGAAT